MKKIILCLSIGILVLTLAGCGTKEVKYDLPTIKKELGSLTGKDFYKGGISEALLESKKLPELEDIYDNDFEKTFGFKGELVEDYSVQMNHTTKDMVILLKPAEGREEELKTKMDQYFSTLLEKEKDSEIKSKIQHKLVQKYEGYLVYIVAEKPTEIFSIVTNCKVPVFGALADVNEEMLEKTVGIKKDDIEEYVMQMPMMIVNSNMYLIVKPNADKYDSVKKSIEDYMVKLEEQWATYLPAQYELVKNRLVKEEGGYLIYIISNDNDSVLEAIQSYKQ